VAAVGGVLPPQWLAELEAALLSGAGRGQRPAFAADVVPQPGAGGAAQRCAADRRAAQTGLCIRHGRKRSGRRVLTVGTDCALGKKYTALALTQALQQRGVAATFRATGQTGIMIAGSGVAIDAVVADFVAGAAEELSPDNAPDHWDVIEGQGALFHPAYAGVTLGLVHGSQPDALVLCHDPSRDTIETYPDFPMPDLQVAIDRYEEAAQLTNRAVRCVGLSINSSTLSDEAWAAYAQETSRRLGCPWSTRCAAAWKRWPTRCWRMIRCSWAAERWEMIEPFEIARETITHLPVLCCACTTTRAAAGWAEAAGMDYDGETPDTMAAQLAAVPPPACTTTSTPNWPAGCRRAAHATRWTARCGTCAPSSRACRPGARPGWRRRGRCSPPTPSAWVTRRPRAARHATRAPSRC
jgi:uncharacterized NAD-dependent epimerase/dehydratase family protein